MKQKMTEVEFQERVNDWTPQWQEMCTKGAVSSGLTAEEMLNGMKKSYRAYISETYDILEEQFNLSIA